MEEQSARQRITLSLETVHNPQEPRHFMRIKPVRGRVRIVLGDRVLADSATARRVLEAGRDIYDPVLYLPKGDVRARIAPSARDRTFCPIKGHASYFDLVSRDGSIEVPEIAWSYHETLAGAEDLQDLVAFDASRVTIEEHPAPKERV